MDHSSAKLLASLFCTEQFFGEHLGVQMIITKEYTQKSPSSLTGFLILWNDLTLQNTFY